MRSLVEEPGQAIEGVCLQDVGHRALRIALGWRVFVRLPFPRLATGTDRRREKHGHGVGCSLRVDAGSPIDGKHHPKKHLTIQTNQLTFPRDLKSHRIYSNLPHSNNIDNFCSRRILANDPYSVDSTIYHRNHPSQNSPTSCSNISVHSQHKVAVSISDRDAVSSWPEIGKTQFCFYRGRYCHFGSSLGKN